MSFPELLRVLEEEAAREARGIRAAAEAERERILAEARAAAGAERDARIAAARADAEAARRGVAETLASERERALLVERRRLLDELAAEAARVLPGAVDGPVFRRLVGELASEAGEGQVELIVDPGDERACSEVLAEIAPAVAERARIRAAPARRGGVELVCGRRVLDDTLPSRLAAVWPAVETELAGVLFGEP